MSGDLEAVFALGQRAKPRWIVRHGLTLVFLFVFALATAAAFVPYRGVETVPATVAASPAIDVIFVRPEVAERIHAPQSAVLTSGATRTTVVITAVLPRRGNSVPLRIDARNASRHPAEVTLAIPVPGTTLLHELLRSVMK